MRQKEHSNQAPSPLMLRAALYDLTVRAEAVRAELVRVQETRDVDESLRTAAQQLDSLDKTLRLANGLLRGERHEIMTALVLSSAHLTRRTMEELEAAEDRARLVWQHGVIVFVPTDERTWAEERQDLAAVFAYARAHGFDWVRFDVDGPTVAKLPDYEELANEA